MIDQQDNAINSQNNAMNQLEIEKKYQKIITNSSNNVIDWITALIVGSAIIVIIYSNSMYGASGNNGWCRVEVGMLRGGGDSLA